MEIFILLLGIIAICVFALPAAAAAREKERQEERSCTWDPADRPGFRY